MTPPESFRALADVNQFIELYAGHDHDAHKLRTWIRDNLEVWPESHWPGFALRQADVLQSYTA